MAKYQRKIRGDFDKILKAIDEAVRIKSSTASLEDVADYYGNGVRSALGGNRVSMSVWLIGSDGEYTLTAITSGGSTGILFKVNTLGEKSFLNTIIETAEKFK